MSEKDRYTVTRSIPFNTLHKIETYIDRYISFHDHTYTLPLALWCMGTHIYQDFDAFPYLVITSLTKRSGKTRLSEIVSNLAANSRNFAAMTGPTLYRSIQDEHPTIIFDEAETLSSEAASIQRSVLNVGYRKGQTIPRTLGGKIQDFDTYCPKVFVLIGDVYDTLKDRSIIVSMKRGEPKERFLYTIAKDEGASIRDETAQAIKAQKENIIARFQAHKGLDFLTDRDEEIWMPLFVLAQIFCPARIQELSRTAVDMSTAKTAKPRRMIQLRDHEGMAVNEKYAQRLLMDLYGLFLDGTRSVSTHGAIEALRAIPVAPWRKFRGDGLDAADLRNLLNKFGVRPVLIRQAKIGKGQYGKVLRGYKREDVERAVRSLK